MDSATEILVDCSLGRMTKMRIIITKMKIYHKALRTLRFQKKPNTLRTLRLNKKQQLEFGI